MNMTIVGQIKIWSEKHRDNWSQNIKDVSFFKSYTTKKKKYIIFHEAISWIYEQAFIRLLHIVEIFF